MLSPEQSQFVDGNPKTAEFIALALEQGHDRRNAADYALDIADELESTSLAAREAARLITDGLVPVEAIIEPTGTILGPEVFAEEQDTSAEISPYLRRIPLRERAVLTADDYASLNTFVLPTMEELEAEVHRELSDEFLQRLVDGSKKMDDGVIAGLEVDQFSTSNFDPTFEEFETWRQMLSNVTDLAANMKTGPDLDSVINIVLSDWDLRKKAVVYIEGEAGKNMPGRAFKVFEEYFRLKQLSDTDFLKITGVMGQLLRDTRDAINRQDYDNIDPTTAIVRNYLRGNGIPLRKLKDGWEVVGPAKNEVTK